MRHLTYRLVSVSFLVALIGCASPPGGGTLQFEGSGPNVGGREDVVVRVDASKVVRERREVFLEQNGSQKIVEAVLGKLTTRGTPRADIHSINVSVTQFRLRSGSSGFWLGAMAGADILGAKVEVIDDGKVVKKFATRTSTVVASIIRPGAVERFDRMVNSLAERIVDGV